MRNKLLGILLLILVLPITSNATTFHGGFGFGSDYELITGNSSLFTSSKIILTNGTAFVGSNATGSFATKFSTATIDVASNNYIPLTLGNSGILNFLYDFFSVDLSNPLFPSVNNIGLAIDLISIDSVTSVPGTGLTVLGTILMKDIVGSLNDTTMLLSMEFSEGLSGNGKYIRSMSGNVFQVNQLVSIPEPESLILLSLGLAILMFSTSKKLVN